jgi:hypothetical protein
MMDNKLIATRVLLMIMLCVFGSCTQPVAEPEVEITYNNDQVELKHDDGEMDSSQAIGSRPGHGYLVHFSPPSTPFAIDKVVIFGKLYGTGYEDLRFTVRVWDKDLEEIRSMSYPHTEFSHSPSWVEVDIPNIYVSGDFYIQVFTLSPEEGGISIGYDSSVENEHSDMTFEGGIDWWGSLPKETVNWMIRVKGK